MLKCLLPCGTRTSLFLLILSDVQLHKWSRWELRSHTLYTDPLCLFQTGFARAHEEKRQRNIRSPQATASIILGNNRGVATRLNIQLKKRCLCTGSLR